MKQFIREIEPNVSLNRDTVSGIAWIKDGRTGMVHSCHPNIHFTGSIKGIKKIGGWKLNDKIIRSHNYYYNISSFCINIKDPLDVIISKECNCKCCLKRRENN